MCFSSALPAESFSCVGEMGIVSRGTADFGSTEVECFSTAAILCKEVDGREEAD